MLDRRKGPDLLTKWVKWSGIISWLIIIVILFLTVVAKPDFESYMDKSLHIILGDTWNISLLKFAFILLVFLFFFCMISMIINLFRSRRKSDRFNKTLIINAAISVIGIVIFLMLLY